MADPLLPLDPSRRPDPAQGVDPSAAPGKTAAGSGAAFRALLEKLELRAEALARETSAVEKPEDLPGAVDSARGALEDALTLQQRLLEAFRQAQRQGLVPPAK